MGRFGQKSAIALLVLAGAIAWAQEPVFRVSTKLVRMIVTVKNPKGELVGDLNKDEFKLTDLGVPQSIAVVTQSQMRDQLMMSVADVVRYVPGISSHQGENNRDQVIIRGNNSSADFFVNGVRDDVYMTTEAGVFACGDMGRGQSLIVWAIAEGRSCAAGVDTYLMGDTLLPAPIAPTARQLL